MTVPRYVEQALLRLDDPDDGDALVLELARLLPFTAERVGLRLQNAALTIKREAEES